MRHGIALPLSMLAVAVIVAAVAAAYAAKLVADAIERNLR